VAVVDVGGARVWYDEAGEGPTVLLLHGGLGDSGLWEPVVPFLAQRFRTIRTDLRFFGRSTGPAVPWSWEEDVVGVAPGLAGHDGAPYSEEQGARYDAAEAEGDLEAAMAVDFEVWAPLGADDRIRQLWRATPDANPLPDGVEPLAPAGAAAKERLGELAIPVLVVTAKHDPPGFREIGPLVARAAPDVRHVELDSDHYVTLREPELVARTLLEFLAEVSPNARA